MKDQNVKNGNEVIVEVSIRLAMKVYKFRLGTKKAWLVAILLLAIRILSWILKEGP